MEITREIESELQSWKNATHRKPLILQGARQVGKTWLLKKFGSQEFESVAYFNFDEQPELKQFFTQTKDVQRIIQNLSLVHGKAIVPGKTLLVFDEIQAIEPIPDIFFSRLVEKLKMYYITGGLPEPVITLLENQDMERTQQVLMNILKAYSLDFSKHISNKDIPKISYIWNSIPSQLARENKKFIFQQVKHGARAREYEDALQWLVLAGLVTKVVCNTKPALPLSAYDELSNFKLYLLDSGLLRRLSLLDPIAIKEGNRLFVEFKGALSENYILQSLIPQFEVQPRYWTSGNKAEIDFLIQYQNEIIPIEVKSDENIHGKSLTMFYKQFRPSLRIRYSLRNLKYDDGLLNIPLFMAGHTKKLIGLVSP